MWKSPIGLFEAAEVEAFGSSADAAGVAGTDCSCRTMGSVGIDEVDTTMLCGGGTGSWLQLVVLIHF